MQIYLFSYLYVVVLNSSIAKLFSFEELLISSRLNWLNIWGGENIASSSNILEILRSLLWIHALYPSIFLGRASLFIFFKALFSIPLPVTSLSCPLSLPHHLPTPPPCTPQRESVASHGESSNLSHYLGKDQDPLLYLNIWCHYLSL